MYGARGMGADRGLAPRCRFGCLDCDWHRLVSIVDDAQCLCGHTFGTHQHTCRRCKTAWRNGQPLDWSPGRLFSVGPCSHCGSALQCRSGFCADSDKVYCLTCWAGWHSERLSDEQDVVVQVVDGECRYLSGEKILDVTEQELQNLGALRIRISAAIACARGVTLKRVDAYDIWPREYEAFQFPCLWDAAPAVYPWRLRLLLEDGREAGAAYDGHPSAPRGRVAHA